MTKLINIIFGTQTGNAEQAANEISEYVKSVGFQTLVQELDDVDLNKLKDMSYLMVVTSTFGDGEMPGNATIFWSNLTSSVNDSLDLNKVNYSVLALGDRTHADFCNAGKLLDEKLEKQGANKVLDRAECDVEYDEISKKWSQSFIKKIA
tara:strand:- start:1551 stop:2000 length:450 start_codon:yes stop_codon:yes gene_type:complete